MDRRLSGVIFCLIVLSASVSVSLVAAQTAPSITTTDSRPIPEQSVTVDGDTFTFSSFTVADPGDTITAQTNVQSDAAYRVYIRNEDKQIVAQKRRTGDASVQFDLSGYSSGMYLLTISRNGNTQAVHPLIIRGYAVSVSGPTSATTSESVRYNISVEYLRGNTLDTVQLAVVDDDTTIEVDATQQSGTERDGVYTAQVDLSSVSPGTYRVIGIVRGDRTVYGEDVVFGGSRSLELQVSDPTPTQTTSQSTGQGADPGSSPTTTTSTTTTPTVSTTERSPTTRARSTVANATSPTITTSDTTSVTRTTTTTEAGVLTPQSPTTNQTTQTTTGAGPGFSIGAGLLATVTFVLFLYRRS